MNLKMLIKDMKIENMTGSADVDVMGIAYDSRKVKPGDVFVAAKGEKCDGHDFISDAVKKGAVAVVYEKDNRRKGEIVTDSPIHRFADSPSPGIHLCQ